MTDINLFDYSLPEELIAQYPAKERDSSRLLVVCRATGKIEHRKFSDLPEYLREGDVLVFNNSRVIKARLFGIKEGTGARIEFLLLKQSGSVKPSGGYWEVLARPAKRLGIGSRIMCDGGIVAEVEDMSEDGSTALVYFSCDGNFDEVLDRVGHVPLPPYIRREDGEADAERYQTVYAREPGSAAAPTAGLHFTDGLLKRLCGKGVETVFVTLHVGVGTFRPVQAEIIENHQMHAEYYHIGEVARERINLAKAEGRRLICVGTTSVRAIEGAVVWGYRDGKTIESFDAEGSTELFFYPGGRKFAMTDGLITNFHLPKSTLLMLVSAFYDREKVLDIYREAIAQEYRFFSYGDAMLII